jgi:hypothetical protein
VSATFINDALACLGLCRRFLDTQIDFVDAVVAVSYYVFMKFFYFFAKQGDVIFSFMKENISVFILLKFSTKNCIYYLF